MILSWLLLGANFVTRWIYLASQRIFVSTWFPFFLVNSTFLADISAILYQGICVCWSLSATSQYLYTNSHALSLALWFIILNHISLPLVDFVLLFSATSQYFSYMHSGWLMIEIHIRHTNNFISYLFTSICRCQIIWKHLNVGLYKCSCQMRKVT